MAVSSEEKLFTAVSQLLKHGAQLRLSLDVLERLSYHWRKVPAVRGYGEDFVSSEVHVVAHSQGVDVLREIEEGFASDFPFINQVDDLADDRNLAGIEVGHRNPVRSFNFLHVAGRFWPLQVLVDGWRPVNLLNLLLSELFEAPNRMKHFIVLT